MEQEEGERRRAERLEFRRHLKQHHGHFEVLYEMAREVEGRTDCKACGRCCRETRVEVSEEDLEGLGEVLGLSAEAVRHECVEGGELRQVAGECVFLVRGECLVYEGRPKACREFPHVDGHGMTLGSRVESVFRHAEVCPILEEAIGEFMQRMGWRGKAAGRQVAIERW